MPGLLTAKRLREERANLASRMQEILDGAGEAGLSTEQSGEFDRLHEQQESLKADIERIERHESLQSELAQSQGVLAGRQDRTQEQREREERGVETGDRGPSREAVDDAFDTYLRHGVSGMTVEQRGIMQSRFTTLSAEQRALSVGTDAAGGYTVPEGFYGQVIEAQKAFGGMRRARTTQFSTDSGADLPIPTDNDTANMGAIVGENVQNTEQDMAFGQIMLGSHLFSSKIVRVSIQLLQDGAFDINGYLARKLGQRIGRKANAVFTTGTGTGEPYGVATGAASGKVGATGQTTSVTVDDLIDLEHSVDADYRLTAEWMFHDTTLKAIKKLKDSQGRPLWQSGLAVREPDTINGYAYVVNNDMAQMAANAKSILFGDFSLYFIRDVRGVQLLRLSERYADYLQVGFLAFSRHDGRLVDAGTNPVKHYANSAT
jgi:HK97 family phage major capsid protein